MISRRSILLKQTLIYFQKIHLKIDKFWYIKLFTLFTHLPPSQVNCIYLVYRVTDPEYKLVQSKISTIWRRYTEFEQIHDYLQVTYPHVVIPPLPEKRVRHSSTYYFNPTCKKNVHYTFTVSKAKKMTCLFKFCKHIFLNCLIL